MYSNNRKELRFSPCNPRGTFYAFICNLTRWTEIFQDLERMKRSGGESLLPGDKSTNKETFFKEIKLRKIGVRKSTFLALREF